MIKLLFRSAKQGSPQSRPLALWGKEGQRSECALTFEKSRGKQYIACPGVLAYHYKTAIFQKALRRKRFVGPGTN